MNPLLLLTQASRLVADAGGLPHQTPLSTRVSRPRSVPASRPLRQNTKCRDNQNVFLNGSFRGVPGLVQIPVNLDGPGRDYMVRSMNQARERVIDELLVVRCQEGSRESFDLLVRRWQRRLWRYARKLTGRNDAAWDVMQETWIAIMRQIRKLSDPAWFAAWAHRIVRNKCADYSRGASRQRHLADALAERQGVNTDPPREGPGDAVAEALRQLPPDKQEVLTLRYGGDLNIIEIAVILGIPAGTVKSRLHHAREQLKRILKGDEP